MEGSQSQLDFIPESHTDFIFAVIVEEFGFLGALGLFLLYAFLIHRLLYVAKSSNSKFAKLVSATLSIILAAYITLNISMVVGIFPVVGMPLPFISQGGTALVVNMITIGIILSLRRTI
jgi:rod shape determining protein RodA